MDFLKDSLPNLIIKDEAIAETLLSVLIGGIISLTVFSFTMVMVVLSQASSNFSPRLLPGLISDKRHQRILGIYLGTLLYCLLNLIFLGSGRSEGQHFGLAVMIAAIFGVFCLVLFVQFIHGISSSIQIHRIVEKVYADGCLEVEKAEKSIDAERLGMVPQTDDWEEILSDKTGYYKGFDCSLIEKKLQEKVEQLRILSLVDTFLWEGTPVMRVAKPVSEEERRQLLFAFRVSSDRHGSDSYFQAMIKLMEIAVKAMSPGINDPGTAIEAVHKLGQLLNRAMRLPKVAFRKNNRGVLRPIENYIDAKTFCNTVIQPIRHYAKSDRGVLEQLICALKFIQVSKTTNALCKEVIQTELDCMETEIQKNFEQVKDKEYLLDLLAS